MANQHTEGIIETQPGKPCASRIWSSGITTVKSIQVAQAPKSGSVSVTSASSFRFSPRAGFSGQDTMTLRIHLTGSQNIPSVATLTLRITVR